MSAVPVPAEAADFPRSAPVIEVKNL